MAAVDVIARFSVDHVSIEAVQRTLDTCVGLLDGSSPARTWIHDAVEDLEMIRFGMLDSEQRPAAVFRLDLLRERLKHELESGSIDSS